MYMKKGFTLIELLIVIAIIGILASIIVVTLGGETNAAADAKNKANVAQLSSLSFSKLFKDNKLNYLNVCASGSNRVPEIGIILNAIGATVNQSSTVSPGTANKLLIFANTNDSLGTFANIGTGCLSNKQKWVVWFDLKEKTGREVWCVDSGGFRGEITLQTVAIAKTDVTCALLD